MIDAALCLSIEETSVKVAIQVFEVWDSPHSEGFMEDANCVSRANSMSVVGI